MNGIHEVTGSTPVWSTTSPLTRALLSYFADRPLSTASPNSIFQQPDSTLQRRWTQVHVALRRPPIRVTCQVLNDSCSHRGVRHCL